MPDVAGIFTVQPEQITRLGPAFAHFVKRLLATETAAAELAGAQLVTNYGDNLGD